MTTEEFKNVVAYYGEENILGVIFDNAKRKVFEKGEFKLNVHLVEELDSLQFLEIDPNDNKYYSVTHIENIQGILIIHPDTKWNDLEKRYLAI